MTSKNQNSQELSTEEKLEFFIERAEALARYFSENFQMPDLTKFSITRNTNIEGDEWKFHTLTYGLICLIRLYFCQAKILYSTQFGEIYEIKEDYNQQAYLLENCRMNLVGVKLSIRL